MMAEILSANTTSKFGRKQKFQIPKMDLTPMVDLGFLLLTFFVFSSQLQRPGIMKILYPDDHDITVKEKNVIKQSGALTLLLGARNQIFFYEGLIDENGQRWKKSNMNDIRKEILEKKKKTLPNDFVVIIKPGNNSNYNNLVTILNEMKISLVDTYIIDDPTDAEQKCLHEKENLTFFVK